MSTSDLVELNQLLARYAVNMTKGQVDGVVDVFTPDGTYSAFGNTFTLDQFPQLVAAAPQGLFLVGTALIELDGDTATGTQPLCFVEHSAHDMRIGYYNDTYLRTEAGWRLKTRKMTFIRRSGVHDSGIPHAFEAPTA
ncbi:nuclear transport factor 2 family protein [Rhodococcus sp. NPDC060090]|uniref:nuclear transport factor 2 family protein n=1 Tax=Rhodococcus sp. NPDC060090 TaxID=3347056 RepID=UPI003658F9EF